LALLDQWEGKAEEAEAYLREAASIAEALSLPGELWPLYAALGEKQKAAEIVQSLAARLDNSPENARLREECLAGAARFIELSGFFL